MRSIQIRSPDDYDGSFEEMAPSIQRFFDGCKKLPGDDSVFYVAEVASINTALATHKYKLWLRAQRNSGYLERLLLMAGDGVASRKWNCVDLIMPY
jgi:hypothetical protein